jgi:hypothetical protein
MRESLSRLISCLVASVSYKALAGVWGIVCKTHPGIGYRCHRIRYEEQPFGLVCIAAPVHGAAIQTFAVPHGVAICYNKRSLLLEISVKTHNFPRFGKLLQKFISWQPRNLVSSRGWGQNSLHIAAKFERETQITTHKTPFTAN